MRLRTSGSRRRSSSRSIPPSPTHGGSTADRFVLPAVYKGGDDFISAAFTNRYQHISGDAAFVSANGELVGGKANAQKMFMSGRMKIKGDVMKATKLEPILKKAQTKAKL